MSRDTLSPAQLSAYEAMLTALDISNFVSIEGRHGAGKTHLLRLLEQEYDVEWVSASDMVAAVRMGDIAACAEATFRRVEEAVRRASIVVLDNPELMKYAWRGDNHHTIFLEAMAELLRQTGKRLVVSGESGWIDHFFGTAPKRLLRVEIDEFFAADYLALLSQMLPGTSLAEVDMDLVWKHVPGLSAHELRKLASSLVDQGALDTAAVIAVLDANVISSNVQISEVEALKFSDLPGTEEIAAKLETHVLVPLENAELARRLDIRPKRGILLYGPPGSGKTSVGRALAHRMRGKFFLIDGSFVTEPPNQFFGAVRALVKDAKDNAPSILFVDDADVLFGIEHIAGFARYLLSFLDGLESESAGRVCLMMTAMDAGKIPEAILRSGRVELWLETRLPDAEVRQAILRGWLDGTLPGKEDLDIARLAQLTDGFTPADLRRIASDAKALFAMEQLREKPASSAQVYLERAIANLVDLRARMADNLHDESLRISSLSSASIYAGDGTRPGPAKYGAGIGGLVESATTCDLKKW